MPEPITPSSHISVAEVPTGTPQNIDFKITYANVMLVWGALENQACAIFQELTEMHPLVCRDVFYSARSFNGRLDMVNAAHGIVNVKPEIHKEIAKSFLNKISRYASERNSIAHGDILDIKDEQSKYNGQTILLEGRRAWVTDPPENEATTLDQLRCIHGNFSHLLIFFGKFLQDAPRGASEKDARYLELIRQLPTPARPRILPQNIAAEIEALGQGIQFGR